MSMAGAEHKTGSPHCLKHYAASIYIHNLIRRMWLVTDNAQFVADNVISDLFACDFQF